MLSYVQARYLSPLYAELANDPRPPTFAASTLLSDAPLQQCYARRAINDVERRQRSDVHNWLDAHALIVQLPDGSMAWTRKGESYRARIRAAGIKSVVDLWAWSKAGNAPSVWHHAHNGKPWK